jgi:hypothetical protein
MDVVINFLTRSRIELYFLIRPDSSLVTVPTALSLGCAEGTGRDTSVALSVHLML